MDSSHSDAPPASEADRFAALCGLTTFVTNSKRVLKIAQNLTPAQVSVICTLLLTSGVSISQLTLQSKLPLGTAARLGSAIKCIGTIHTMSLGSCGEFGSNQASELLHVLSVAASPALEQLSIDSLLITSEWLSRDPFGKFTSLSCLTISACINRDRSILLLATKIGQLRALESLHITNMHIRDSDSDVLVAKLGEHLPLLSGLRICSCGLGEKAGRPIGSLVALGRLRKLILDRNRLNDAGVSAMVDAILDLSKSHRCELQQLNLRKNRIGSAGGIKLAELVARSPRLETLNVSTNPIGNTAAEALIQSLQLRAQSLEKLNVTDCKLDPHGIMSLLRTLHDFRVLRALGMGCNHAGDLGAKFLSRFMLSPGGRTLADLQIGNDDITEAGALNLSGAFAKAYNLRSIDMSVNVIKPRGMTAIMDALAAASTVPMDKIDFEGCLIEDVGASAVGRLILRRGCKHLLLAGNRIDTAGAKVIADSIAAAACVIKELDLTENPLEDEGVRYLVNTIVRNRSVHKLCIRNVKVGVEGAIAIKQAVEIHGVPFWIGVSRAYADEEASKVLTGVKNWEQESKPAWAAILEFYL